MPIWCGRLAIPWVGKIVGLAFSSSSHISHHHHEITEILLLWRKTTTTKHIGIETRGHSNCSIRRQEMWRGSCASRGQEEDPVHQRCHGDDQTRRRQRNQDGEVCFWRLQICQVSLHGTQRPLPPWERSVLFVLSLDHGKKHAYVGLDSAGMKDIWDFSEFCHKMPGVFNIGGGEGAVAVGGSVQQLGERQLRLVSPNKGKYRKPLRGLTVRELRKITRS